MGNKNRFRWMVKLNPWRFVRLLWQRHTWELAGKLVVKTYALAILCVLALCGYLSVHYLVKTVFYPPVVPPQMMEWQGTLNVAALRQVQVPGVEQPAARAPISHYHGVNSWFQPDPHNGCTQAGCHDPLPHGAKAKVPAFANFHVTFLTCQMCHQPPANHPAKAGWISTETAAAQEVPAILKLLAFLESHADAIKNDPAGTQTEMTALLQQTITALGGDALLDQLLSELQGSEPGSPVWRRAATMLADELPQHARGEYRAKLAWADQPETYTQQFDELSALARQDKADKRIHAPLAAQPAACVACHDDKPGMLDFAAAGFSAKRSAYLSSLEVARSMQQIREGKPFFFPNLGEGQ